MSDCFSKTFYALVLLLLHAAGSIHGFNKSAQVKCIERERQALLNFKQGLFDRFGMLSTWRDDDNDRDCCKWKGVECHNETGHVQMLDLRGLDTQYLTGAINMTSLVHLQNMEYLDLSYNAFQLIHIPEVMGLFTNLKYLNLSYSSFSGSIPCELGNLTHLQYLDLGGNNLDGEIPYQLGNFTHLQYLSLHANYLQGQIPYQLANLSQLRYLDLGGYDNSLSGAIPFQVGNLPILHTLRLCGNFDVKSKDAEWLSNLHSLRKLDLNSLHKLGSSHHWLQTVSKLIPNLRELRLVGCTLTDSDIQSSFYSHSNFSTSLTILDLSLNMLTSSTFQLLFNFSLNNLQELYLSQNNIVFPSSLHSNFPSIVTLDLSYNNMTSSLFHSNFNFSLKLQNLYLSNCSLTDKSFLFSSTSTTNSSSSLVSLDLSYNLLKSSAIFHLLFNFTTNLHTLYLQGNLLEGPIPDGFGKVMNSLEDLDLYFNKLQGKLPTFFGNMCTLQTLDLSHNNLSGEISSFIQNSSWCNRHIFKRLNLAYNRISGMLPKSIGLLSKLEGLYLEGNSLEGDVTELHLSNISKLKYLSLSDNSLSVKFVSSWVPPFQVSSLDLASCNLGPSFPGWLRTQTSLLDLDISNNGLHDSVPEWFRNNMQYMSELNMSHNSLTGEVPSFLRQASKLILSKNKFSNLFSFLCDQNTHTNLAILDLSKNQIKGQLPDCWKSVDALWFLDLSNNKLSGKIPKSMGTLIKLETLVLRNNGLIGELPSTLENCGNLIMLDVGENMLSGPIPSWIGESMPQLIILIMRGNHFSGILPIQLCYLRHIQMLDLSKNKLSEGIPTCLKNFTTMSKMNINQSETLNRIYSPNSTSYEIDGMYIFLFHLLDITWMWKGVEQGFRDPEFLLKSIDLSCNKLTGEIPKEVGYLLGLVSLNLSRNNLSGEIPSEIGNLRSLDFLDLSRNHFSGRIPSSLSQIDGLGKLDLSHNSLSGRIPLGRHLETFDASSFEGNIDLCGEQLNKSCPEDQTRVKPQGQAIHDEDSTFFESLFMSFGLGFFTGFWGLIGPILLWQPWRKAYLRFLNRLTDYIYIVTVVNMAKCHRWLED